MTNNTQSRRRWVQRGKIFAVVGLPTLLVLAFFSLFGLGPFVYPITDALRGHPHGRHGTQPLKFIGLWVRDETVEYDSFGQAFYLTSDGRFAGSMGMTERRWHFDKGHFYVDSISHCGNCNHGNITTEASVTFTDADHMTLSSKDTVEGRGLVGHYRRVQITPDYTALVAKQMDSEDDTTSFRARSVERAIQHFEFLSKKS